MYIQYALRTEVYFLIKPLIDGWSNLLTAIPLREKRWGHTLA